MKADRDPLHKILGLVNRCYSASYAKRYRHIGRIYQKRYFAKEVDSRLGLLTISSYIHRNPIQTKVPMVERLHAYPYSSFPLYWDGTLPSFLDRQLLPEPFEKNNTAYCMYCLTYAQNAEEVPHVEDMEPPVMWCRRLSYGRNCIAPPLSSCPLFVTVCGAVMTTYFLHENPKNRIQEPLRFLSAALP